MTHPEHDRLISLAFGEPDDDDAAHVAGCVSCRAELATLRQVVAVGAETQSLRDLPEPPPRVWEGITAALGAADNVVPLRTRHRWPPWATAVVAAAAAAVVAVAVTLAVVWPGGGRTPDEIVASAVLEAFGNTPPAAHGDAEVLADGQLRLQVADLPPVNGYYQVWLIDPKTMRMFALGVLGEGSEAQLPLPSDVDLSRYSVVDVSAEQFDDNPAHSGDSLLRGELT